MLASIILVGMLLFLDRSEEIARLDALVRRSAGGLAVVHGRRRLGKTRLLVEWCRRHAGLYSVADQSTPDIQRRYLAEALSTRLPAFGDVTYPTWQALLDRLAGESLRSRWRGPVVFDELPYLVSASPELPSALQRFVDGPAREARLVLAIAGSSQRMMQGIVLSSEAPLYGRATVVLDVGPLPPAFIGEALGPASVAEQVAAWTAWGGVPRYWELAADESGPTRQRVERLVLDPLGPLHREPDRLLLEEMPPAVEVRPILDAIGAGAHRVSEIAGRMGRPATSLSRPLDRLVQLGLAIREIPFGDPERGMRRSLYRIADPFFRLWFRVVASHRGELTSGTRETRLALLDRHWPGLVAAAWEELCRKALPQTRTGPLAGGGPWGPASRWWRGNLPEWDIVSSSRDGKRLLLGEAWWTARPATRPAVERAAAELAARPLPHVELARGAEVVRVLFVPAKQPRTPRRIGGVRVVTAGDVMRAVE